MDYGCATLKNLMKIYLLFLKGLLKLQWDLLSRETKDVAPNLDSESSTPNSVIERHVIQIKQYHTTSVDPPFLI